MIAALFVLKDGPYAAKGFDVWPKERDARLYNGPHKVIAHPPCERWGRYWGGGPMLHGTDKQKLLGDDHGCFDRALWAVRTFGGVLEHPEASSAWRWFNLPRPLRLGGWTKEDTFGGRACCVAQGHYGHKGQKLTWLYGVNIDFKELKWGPCKGKNLLDEGFHSKEERARKIKTGICQRLSSRQRLTTPDAFRNLLSSMVSARIRELGEK